MAKKPSYKDFKPFQPDSGRTFTYKANSDGVNNELGPKVILPPKPKTEGKRGQPLAKVPLPQGKRGQPLAKVPLPQGKRGKPLPKVPLPQGKRGLPLPRGPLPQGKRGLPLAKTPLPQGKRGLPLAKTPLPQGKKGLPLAKAPLPQGKKGLPLAATPGGNYNEWPLSKFAFKVNIGGFDGELSFQGMDGLGATVGKMEFRDGNSSKFYKQTRPTLTSYDPVTLKKGMFEGDTVLFDWFKNVSQGSMFSDMRTVSIDLCEMSGGGLTSIFKWTLEKAYITKFTPSNLDGESDTEIAIEEIELTYQSFSMDAGGLLGSLGGLFGSAGGFLGKIANSVQGAENLVGNISKGISGAVSGKISF